MYARIALQCGIIEVVPNTTSRDQLGKKVEGTLYEYFQDKYGPINSIEFDVDMTGPEEEGLSRAERRSLLEAA